MEIRTEMLALVAVLLTVGCVSTKAVSEIDELRIMFRQTVEQNRKLEAEISRLNVVWSGFRQMCSALSMSTCDCKSAAGKTSESVTTPGSDSVTTVPDNVTTIPDNVTAISDNVTALRILSVKSSGIINGRVIHLTVVYTSAENHLTDWLIGYNSYERGGVFRTEGNRLSHGNMTYSTRCVVPNVDKMTYASLTIYTDNEITGLMFNLAQILTKGEQDLLGYQPVILSSINPTYVAPRDGDLNITFTVSGTWHENLDLKSNAVIMHIGTVTDKATPGYFHVGAFFTGAYDIWHKDTRNASTVVLTAMQPISQYGGVVSLLLPTTAKDVTPPTQFVNELKYGVTFNVVSPVTDAVIPNNTVAIYRWGERKIITLSQSLTCFTVGNPLPDVQMFRDLDDGSRQNLQTEALVRNNFIRTEMYWLSMEQHPKTPVNYTCRAVSGNAVAEVTTQVVVFESPTFDEARTGVIKNNTKEVVFGCKASADQTPELEFRLYDNLGPNLANNQRYKVSYFTPGKKTARISLVASPPDYSLHTVVCVASVYGINTYREIQLFPGLSPEWDWALYNSTKNMLP